MTQPSAGQVRSLVKQGKALPAMGRPGRFPIRNRADLQNAIRAVGRVNGGEPARAKVRRFIMRRARALGATDMVPDSWKSDGTLK